VLVAGGRVPIGTDNSEGWVVIVDGVPSDHRAAERAAVG
jgi:hypothetical protein